MMMKRKLPVLILLLTLLSGTIACFLLSSAAPEETPAPLPEILFEENDFSEAGCFFDNSTDEINYFVEDSAFHIDVLVPEWYGSLPLVWEKMTSPTSSLMPMPLSSKDQTITFMALCCVITI